MKLTTIMLSTLCLSISSLAIAQSSNSGFNSDPSTCFGVDCSNDPLTTPGGDQYSTPTFGSDNDDWLDWQNNQFGLDDFHPQKQTEQVCLTHCWKHARASRALCIDAQTPQAQGPANDAGEALQRLRINHINQVCDDYASTVFNQCVIREKCF